MEKSVLYTLLSSYVKAKGRLALKSKPAESLEGTFVDFQTEYKSDKYTAGFARSVMLPADIDTAKYYIAGYSDNNPARGVIDPQYAHAMWLDDNSGRGGVLFISLDVVGLLNKDVQHIRDSLKDFCKMSKCRYIGVFSTHNHAGLDTMGIWGRLPFSGKNEKFMNILFDKVRECAYGAYENRYDGQLYLGEIEVPDMQEDIRTPIVYSKTLSRFRFVPENGGNEIWLLNFASHSESLQGCNHLVSADFPCYLREKIKAVSGADVLYTVGAIGGMISMDIADENLLKNEHRLLESTRNIGCKLADYALCVKNEIRLSPLVNFARKEFYCDVENPVLTVACDIGILTAEKFARKSAPMYWCLKSEISYFEIGGKKVLFLPCEIFPELVFGGYLNKFECATGQSSETNPKPLGDILNDKNLLVFGLANDELGYVLPPNDFLLNSKSPYIENGKDKFGRKHYEETNSMGPKTAQTIADAVVSMYKSIKKI